MGWRCEQNTHSYIMYRCAQCVTTHTEQYDHISSREHTCLKGAQPRVARIGVLKQLSSACHVSFLAAPDTDHKHKFSLTYSTYLSDVLFLTPKTFGARSIFTVRKFTAEWRINTNPISHRRKKLDGRKNEKYNRGEVLVRHLRSEQNETIYCTQEGKPKMKTK